MIYYTYILKCFDNSLYTGITTDMDRRVREHNEGKGCKYTLTRRPVKCLYMEKHFTRSRATKRELEIKSWKRSRKLEFVKSKQSVGGKKKKNSAKNRKGE